MKRIMLVLGALVVSAGVLMAEQKEWTNKSQKQIHSSVNLLMVLTVCMLLQPACISCPKTRLLLSALNIV